MCTEPTPYCHTLFAYMGTRMYKKALCMYTWLKDYSIHWDLQMKQCCYIYLLRKKSVIPSFIHSVGAHTPSLPIYDLAHSTHPTIESGTCMSSLYTGSQWIHQQRHLQCTYLYTAFIKRVGERKKLLHDYTDGIVSSRLPCWHLQFSFKLLYYVLYR